MKLLDNILKICGIVLLITLTFKVFTFENSGRYVFRGEKHSDTLDSKTGIVTVFNKSKTSLHKIYQVNPMKGEIRYFLDEKWDDWMKFKNREIGQ